MKNSKIILTVVGVLVGFGLGYLCANVSFGENNGKGDITKVSKYSKTVVSPQASAFQEKIMNDPEAFKQAQASLIVVGTRMRDFDKLVDFAKQSCAGIEELAPALAKIEKVSTLSANAKNAALAASESFNAMVDGVKGSAADFETASQNLSLAFLMVDRQLSVGKDFVASVDAYLKDKDVKDNFSLATTRDLWAGYCAGQAIIDGDNAELEFWSNQKTLISKSVLADIDSVDQMGCIFNNEMNFASILGVAADSDAVIRNGQNINGYDELEAIVSNETLVSNMEKIGYSEVLGIVHSLGANDVLDANTVLGEGEKIIMANEVLGTSGELNLADFLSAASQFGMGVKEVIGNNTALGITTVISSFDVIGNVIDEGIGNNEVL